MARRFLNFSPAVQGGTMRANPGSVRHHCIFGFLILHSSWLIYPVLPFEQELHRTTHFYTLAKCVVHISLAIHAFLCYTMQVDLEAECAKSPANIAFFRLYLGRFISRGSLVRVQSSLLCNLSSDSLIKSIAEGFVSGQNPNPSRECILPANLRGVTAI
jgi:hypothetical protein